MKLPPAKQVVCVTDQKIVHSVITCTKKIADSDLEVILETLMQAENTEDQMKLFKQLVLQCADLDSRNQIRLDFIAEVYLRVGLKCPLRSGIVRLLGRLPLEQHEPLARALARSLLKLFSVPPADHVAAVTSALTGCFDNFPDGVAAIRLCQDAAVDYMYTALHTCFEQFRCESCPAVASDLCQRLHSAVRTCISLLQRCGPVPPSSLLPLSRLMLAHPALPVDTRATCGILATLAAVLLHGQLGFVKLLDDIKGVNDLTVVCTVSGLLSTLAYSDLASVITYGGQSTPVFPVLFSLIMDIGQRNPTENTLVLTVSRSLVLVSRHALLLTSVQLAALLARLCSFLDHYMDAVRHLARSALANLVKADTNMDIVSAILSIEVALPTHQRAKHAIISVLVGRIPVTRILETDNQLVKKLIAAVQDGAISSHAVNSLEALMWQHCKEEPDSQDWSQLWLQPVMSAVGQCPLLEPVIAKAVRHSPHILDHLLRLYESSNESLGTLLSCLRMARKCGLSLRQSESTEEKWRGLVHYTILEKALCHTDDEVRLLCLALLIECQKSTEAYMEQELRLMEQFLEYNMNCQSPASRQRALGLVKKFLIRLQESLQSLRRMADQCRQSPNQVRDSAAEAVKVYSHFLCWLGAFCFANLFPGANTSRRVTSLGILCLVRSYGLWPAECDTARNASVLLASLRDTYEENKRLALHLLTAMPAQLIGFEKAGWMAGTLEECLSVCSGTRVSDSVSAAYLLNLLTRLPAADTMLTTLASPRPGAEAFFRSAAIPDKGVFTCIVLSLLRLEAELAVACRSVMLAASSGPLYGHLFAIRHLLQQVSLRDKGIDESWQHLIGRLVPVCFQCSQVVACVVNNASPEGHLPMDFDYDLGVLKPDEKPVTAQLVLVCSWRTVKEVSLLLGELAERAPLQLDSTVKQGWLLCDDQLLAIGDHLTALLSETKHRGAFEQAYVGFCKLATRLWRLPQGKLHTLPQVWLNETLELIESSNNLCATRRSAGIPFMVQALVCSELEGGMASSAGGRVLGGVMERLLLLAGSAVHSVQSKTHALNILRSLYRSTQLGDHISPYVAQGIVLAVNGFSASSWPERNSSTLLLSALMARVFGVPRARGSRLSWRNRMTGRTFFQRYPQLFTFIRVTLERACTHHSTLQPSLYPVLLLLARLYPSSLERTDSNVQLSEFIPPLVECSGSSIMKTRCLAAAAIVPLITPNIYISHLCATFMRVLDAPHENLLHGLLLQLLYLLRDGPDLSKEIESDIDSMVESWVAAMLCVLNSRHSYVCKETSLQILCLLSDQFVKHMGPAAWQLVTQQLEEDLFEQCLSKLSNIGVLSYEAMAAQLLLKLSILSNHDDKFMVELVKLLKHGSYRVVNTVLDVMHCLLTDSDFKQDDDEYWLLDFVSLDRKHKEVFKEAVCRNKELADLIVDKLLACTVLEDLMKLLNVSVTIPITMTALGEQKDSAVCFLAGLASSTHESVAPMVVYCLDTCLQLLKAESAALSESEREAVSNILSTFSSDDCDTDCRLSVAQLLVNSYDLLTDNASALQLLVMWSCAVGLFSDEDSSVRNTACSLVAGGCNVTPSMALCTFMDQLVLGDCSSVLLAAALLGWTLGQMPPAALSELDEDDHVFDKGETNSYSEEIVVSRLASNHLKRKAAEHPGLMSCQLEPAVLEWLSGHCSLEMGSANTIGAVIAVAALCLKEQCTLPCGVLPALLDPGARHKAVTAAKLECLASFACDAFSAT